MKLQRMVQGTVIVAGLLAFGMVQAQGRTDYGKSEYDNNCAVCHGKTGKGDGPYLEMLRKSPPDLTTMAKRNGAVFPVARTYEVIEGAGVGHGTRDMPIWGKHYNTAAAELYVDVPYNAEAHLRGRILALIEYLNRLQVQ